MAGITTSQITLNGPQSVFAWATGDENMRIEHVTNPLTGTSESRFKLDYVSMALPKQKKEHTPVPLKEYPTEYRFKLDEEGKRLVVVYDAENERGFSRQGEVNVQA